MIGISTLVESNSSIGTDQGLFTLTAANNGTFQATTAAVHEPSSFVIAGTGALIGLGYAWRRRRRATA